MKDADEIAAQVFYDINGHKYKPKKADHLERVIYHSAAAAAQLTLDLVLAGMEQEES